MVMPGGVPTEAPPGVPPLPISRPPALIQSVSLPVRGSQGGVGAPSGRRNIL